MAAEEQQEKRAAALNYNFEEDNRWHQYYDNILIPAHLSSSPDVLRHYKLKFYQRFIDSELEVEPLKSVAPPAAPSISPSSADHRRPVNTAPRSSASSRPGRSAPPPASSPSLRMDQQTFQFLNNAWVLIMAALAFLPLIPLSVSNRAYRFTFFGTAIGGLHSIYLRCGFPRSWNLQGIQQWLRSVVTSNELLYIMFSVIFISSGIPIKFAVVPLLCRSLELVAQHLRRNFSNTQLYRNYLYKPCVWVDSNTYTLHTVSANSEIGLGFLLIFLIFTPQRNLLQALLYWQLLKLKYQAPSSAPYHVSTWTRIGATVEPLIGKYAPVLQRPLDILKHWFLARQG